jgi:hypothetical protein
LYLDQSQKGSSSSRGRGLALGTLRTFAQSESWKKEEEEPTTNGMGHAAKEPRPKHSREQPNNKPVFTLIPPSSSLTPSWIQEEEEEVSLRPGAKHTRENLRLFWASSSSSSSSSCAIKIIFNRETDNDDRFFVRSKLYRFVHYLIFFFSFFLQVQLFVVSSSSTQRSAGQARPHITSIAASQPLQSISMRDNFRIDPANRFLEFLHPSSQEISLIIHLNFN